MKIAIGSDHAGFELKAHIIEYLKREKETVLDKGCFSAERADYPDFAHLVSISVSHSESDFGILICGSGNGIAMTANKHSGIRAAVCWSEEIAALARMHNNANVLVLPARFIDKEEALNCVARFLIEKFEGGRHQERIKKIEIKP